MRHITRDWLLKNKTKMLNLANITEHDIQRIWIKPGEEELQDFSKMVYNYNAPLYQKMIWRYRNGKRLVENLFNGCDPNNQFLLLREFKLNLEDRDLVLFFFWMTNSLGTYEILKLDNKTFTTQDQSELLKLWQKKENTIIFFFLLDIDKQNRFMEGYNTDIVNRWNESRFNDKENSS